MKETFLQYLKTVNINSITEYISGINFYEFVSENKIIIILFAVFVLLLFRVIFKTAKRLFYLLVGLLVVPFINEFLYSLFK